VLLTREKDAAMIHSTATTNKEFQVMAKVCDLKRREFNREDSSLANNPPGIFNFDSTQALHVFDNRRGCGTMPPATTKTFRRWERQ
jgi:hypothetical protein